MATYSVEPLRSDEDRDDFYDQLDMVDALTIAEYVKGNFPAVFDHAAAKVDRINAQLAEVHRKQEGKL